VKCSEASVKVRGGRPIKAFGGATAAHTPSGAPRHLPQHSWGREDPRRKASSPTPLAEEAPHPAEKARRGPADCELFSQNAHHDDLSRTAKLWVARPIIPLSS
jgi:hypothetical protein